MIRFFDLFVVQPSLVFYLTFSFRVPRSCRTSVHLLFFFFSISAQKSLVSLAHLKWREREKRPFAFFGGYFFLVFLLPFSSCAVCPGSVSLVVN